eukprot:snap_masked-scaffold44_size478958-processed-gene-3.9 protein:Tk06928 transcript:snap_masked-scaffold44_size478958-processed-gene-3.9-mRNA-1 annotation:"hypothetical protein EAI_13582"
MKKPFLWGTTPRRMTRPRKNPPPRNEPEVGIKFAYKGCKVIRVHEGIEAVGSTVEHPSIVAVSMSQFLPERSCHVGDLAHFPQIPVVLKPELGYIFRGESEAAQKKSNGRSIRGIAVPMRKLTMARYAIEPAIVLEIAMALPSEGVKVVVGFDQVYEPFFFYHQEAIRDGIRDLDSFQNGTDTNLSESHLPKMDLEWEIGLTELSTPPPIPPPPPVPPFLRSDLCPEGTPDEVVSESRMDLLLQLSIFLMLGSLGLLLTFTIFLCVFRLCFCGGQSRFTPRSQRSNGDMLDHLLDEETGEMEESDISENHPRPTFWRLPWLKGDKDHYAMNSTMIQYQTKISPPRMDMDTSYDIEGLLLHIRADIGWRL